MVNQNTRYRIVPGRSPYLLSIAIAHAMLIELRRIDRPLFQGPSDDMLFAN